MGSSAGAGFAAAGPEDPPERRALPGSSLLRLLPREDLPVQGGIQGELDLLPLLPREDLPAQGGLQRTPELISREDLPVQGGLQRAIELYSREDLIA